MYTVYDLHSEYDRMYGDFPAKSTAYTPYMSVCMVIPLLKIPYTVRYRNECEVRKNLINNLQCEQCEGGNTMRAYARASWPSEPHLHAYARACAGIRVRACA